VQVPAFSNTAIIPCMSRFYQQCERLNNDNTG
jgi:hypothetical protein